jgi:DNA-directed RNA polymerase specialized sigma24 family protein
MDHSPPGDPPATRPRPRPRPLTPEELDDFYRRYYRSLLRHVLRRHHLSSEDAADIVQETFLLALRKLDPGRNPQAWLKQVADHKCANLRRMKIRRADLLARWG